MIQAADPDHGRLLPTQGLTLRARWRRDSLPLIDGLDNFCAVTVAWDDAQHLFLRVPEDRASALRVKDGDSWDGVHLRVLLHDDLVTFRQPSPDGQRVLLVIKDCTSEAWNLYLRQPGEPDYDAAMQTGWDDPRVFGGFGPDQAPRSLRWTGPRSAEIEVPGRRYEVTLRDRMGDVTVHWRFLPKATVPTPVTNTLAPLD